MLRLPGPGEVIDGKYLIEGPLGQGGMGVVFAGRNLAGDFPVAVKWLLPEHADNATAVARFRREAQMAAYIRSRNVVQIYDVGVEQPYFVMERLQGQSLRDFMLRCGPEGVPLRDLGSLLLPTLAGVSAAHRTRTPSGQAVIHRDLKPDNVFLAESADGMVPTVLDFGIARLAEAADSLTVNTANMILGTPHYMAREQFFDQERIGPWTDVHALGVILYEMVAGRRPFEQASGQTPWDLVMKVSLGQFEPVVHVRQAFHDVRFAQLDAIISKATAPEIEDRYQSVQELVKDLSPLLQAFSKGEPATSSTGIVPPGMFGVGMPGVGAPGPTSRAMPGMTGMGMRTPARVPPMGVSIRDTRRPNTQSGRAPNTLSPVVTTLAEGLPTEAEAWQPDESPRTLHPKQGKSLGAVLVGVVAAVGLLLAVRILVPSPASDAEFERRPKPNVGPVQSGGEDLPTQDAVPGVTDLAGPATASGGLSDGTRSVPLRPDPRDANGWEDGTVDTDEPEPTPATPRRPGAVRGAGASHQGRGRRQHQVAPRVKPVTLATKDEPVVKPTQTQPAQDKVEARPADPAPVEPPADVTPPVETRPVVAQPVDPQPVSAKDTTPVGDVVGDAPGKPAPSKPRPSAFETNRPKTRVGDPFIDNRPTHMR